MDTKEKIKAGWIHSIIVIEILGKPAEYVSRVIKSISAGIKKENNIEIIKEKIGEPKFQENEKMYSSFVELELIVKDAGAFQNLIFSYMPSSIEIISPSEFKIGMNDMTVLFNDLTAKLHEYDNFVKKLKASNIILGHKLKELKPDLSDKDFEEILNKLTEEANQ